MNDFTNNPFDLPNIDKKDIPVLDDVVVPGSVHENRTPIIPEQAVSGLADYNFDTHKTPAYFTEGITPEEIAKVAFGENADEIHDTDFAIEDRDNEYLNQTSINIANELHIEVEQLNELIEQITTEVQHKLESRIEESIKQAMEDGLIQHKEFIRESIHTHLTDILNNISPKQEN